MVTLNDSLEIEELPNIIHKHVDSDNDSGSEADNNENSDQEKEGGSSEDEAMNIVDFKKENSKVKRTRKEETELNKKKKLSVRIGYEKPDFANNREYERKLSRLATRGVVQLFNAVAEHTKLIIKKETNAKLRAKKRQAVKEEGASANSEKISGTKRPKLANKEPKSENDEIKIDSEGPDWDSDAINTSVDVKEETTDWSDEN